MESMITILYLEKSWKVKQFKAKETMGSITLVGQFLAQDSCWLYMVGKCYISKFGMLSTIILIQIHKFQKHISNQIFC